MKNRWPVYALLLCAWLLPAAVWVQIPGIPYGQVTVTVGPYTGTNIPASTCRGAALFQVRLSDMYVRLDTTTATPLATDYYFASGDFFQIREPDRVRLRAPVATGNVVVTCLD